MKTTALDSAALSLLLSLGACATGPADPPATPDGKAGQVIAQSDLGLESFLRGPSTHDPALGIIEGAGGHWSIERAESWSDHLVFGAIGDGRDAGKGLFIRDIYVAQSRGEFEVQATGTGHVLVLREHEVHADPEAPRPGTFSYDLKIIKASANAAGELVPVAGDEITLEGRNGKEYWVRAEARTFCMEPRDCDMQDLGYSAQYCPGRHECNQTACDPSCTLE